jgi:hypothetical protein
MRDEVAEAADIFSRSIIAAVTKSIGTKTHAG